MAKGIESKKSDLENALINLRDGFVKVEKGWDEIFGSESLESVSEGIKKVKEGGKIVDDALNAKIVLHRSKPQ